MQRAEPARRRPAEHPFAEDHPPLRHVGPQGPEVREYLRLKKKPHASLGQQVAVEGIWALEKAVAGAVPFDVLFVCPELIYSAESAEFVRDRVAAGVPSVAVSPRVMERLADRDRPDSLAALVRPPKSTLSDIQLGTTARVVVLDGLELPGNVGTTIRSADSAGATAVVVTKERTHLTHPRVIHGSMGSVFVVKTVVAEVAETVAWLRAHGFTIVTASTRGTQGYRRFDYGDRCAIVLGSERFGISPEWHANEDASVRIPVVGVSDSINVGHAAALLMYEALHAHEPQLFE